jgi:RNA polymerase sigma-70 factor, ECF subfamily
MRVNERFQPVSLVIDRTTFDRLVLEHLSAALRFAIRLTGDASAGEDLMQDALLKAHRSWQTFRGESKFQTWLFQIVINSFRDQVAAVQRTARSLDDQIESRDPAPSHTAQSHELSEIVATEISRLPPRQREVLVLMTYEQLCIRDVAATLGITEQNVRTNLHHARECLRERLRKYLDEP